MQTVEYSRIRQISTDSAAEFFNDVVDEAAFMVEGQLKLEVCLAFVKKWTEQVIIDHEFAYTVRLFSLRQSSYDKYWNVWSIFNAL